MSRYLKISLKLIVPEWKTSEAHFVNLWFGHICHQAALEDLTFRLLKKEDQHVINWNYDLHFALNFSTNRTHRSYADDSLIFTFVQLNTFKK